MGGTYHIDADVGGEGVSLAVKAGGEKVGGLVLCVPFPYHVPVRTDEPGLGGWKEEIGGWVGKGEDGWVGGWVGG